MRNRSHRPDINRSSTYTWTQIYQKQKVRHSIMMVLCIKKHLSNIWSSIHEKVKQHWGWLKKSVAHKKSVFFLFGFHES